MANPNTAQFPGAIVTDTQLPPATSSFQTVLSSDINFSATTIPVSSIAANVPAILRIDNEFILAVGKSGSNFTSCVRGFGGTTAASHLSGVSVFAYVSAHHFNQLAAEVKAIEEALGVNLANISLPDLDPSPAGDYGNSNSWPTITVDAKGRITAAANASLPDAWISYPQYFYYRAAIGQGTMGSNAFSLTTANQPTPQPVTMGDNVFGVSEFLAGGTEEMWEHFFIPEDWDRNTSDITCQFRWYSPSTTGNVQWEMAAAYVPAGGTMNIANPASWTFNKSVTDNVAGTTNRLVFSTITMTIADWSELTMGGGDEFFFKISRGTDTCTGAAELLSVLWTFKRIVNVTYNIPG